MTILVYGEKANRTHENQMLQVFLERLEDRWADSTDWIVAVANAMWNGAEIDLVCICCRRPKTDSLKGIVPIQN